MFLKLPTLGLLCLTILFLGSCSRESSTPQVRTNHHNSISTAFSIAVGAVEACQNGETQECEKVSEIESGLIKWCSENDKEACSALDAVQFLEISRPIN